MSHQNGRSIGPDGKEPGMAERYLAGVAYEDIEPDGQDHVHQDDVEEIDVVAGEVQRQGKEEDEQCDGPERTVPLLKISMSS